MKNTITCLSAILKKILSNYDEIWMVGHKGDHIDSLVSLGILKSREVDLLHVQSSLGVKASIVLKNEDSNSDGFYSAVEYINPSIKKHIIRVKSNNLKVCIFSPFPNLGLNRLIRVNNSQKNFDTSSPVESVKQYYEIENKVFTTKNISKKLYDNEMSRFVIPFVYKPSDLKSFSNIKKILKLNENQGIYVQKDLSVGGNGTELINNSEEYNALFKMQEWKKYRLNRQLKITPQILNSYSANGSGCIVPIKKNSFRLFLDPLSHKVVGLNGKIGCSYGNDWSNSWPERVQTQYEIIMNEIAEYLFQKYKYSGIFGVDFLVQGISTGRMVLKYLEINPRWQGTTKYQTLNALYNNQVPLEVIHYIVKLGTSEDKLAMIKNIGSVEKYNKKSLYRKGLFYLKILSNGKSFVVKKDVNGKYKIKKNRFIRIAHSDKNSMDVVEITAPSVGDVVRESITPIGYLFGFTDKIIFDPSEPKLSKYASQIANSANSLLYK